MFTKFVLCFYLYFCLYAYVIVVSYQAFDVIVVYIIIISLPKVIWEQGRVAKGSPSRPWSVRHCAVARIHGYACYAGNFAAKTEGVVEQLLRFC